MNHKYSSASQIIQTDARMIDRKIRKQIEYQELCQDMDNKN